MRAHLPNPHALLTKIDVIETESPLSMTSQDDVSNDHDEIDFSEETKRNAMTFESQRPTSLSKSNFGLCMRCQLETC